MIDYLQPDFYRFNQDSIKLVKFIVTRESKSETILDLGAGCGVLGFELAKVFNPTHLHLVEVQPEYLPFLESNSNFFLPPATKLSISIQSFKEFSSSTKYSLICSNPPYYLPGSGQLSPDPRRNIARSFVRDGWESLLLVVENSLEQEGKAYFVLKNDFKLRQHVEIQLSRFSFQYYWQELEDVIILTLVRLNKN